MTYENIKTVILVILVGSSVLFTWNLWTFQPHLDPIEPSSMADHPIGTEKEIKEVVKPYQIMNVFENDKLVGTMHSSEMDGVIKEISGWTYEKIEDISNSINDIPSFLMKEGHSMILFPDEVPFELYRNVLKVVDKESPNFNFDTIVIDSNDTNEEFGFVYFLSRSNHQVFRGEIDASFLQEYKNNQYVASASSENFAEFDFILGENNKPIYLPVEGLTLNKWMYLPEDIDADRLMKSLFSEPSVVQRSVQSSTKEYTDSTSIMRVYGDRNLISFKNLSVGTDRMMESNPLLRRSIDYINDHGGWTGNYRFFSMDPERDQVVFRLYHSAGYPIFSDSAISKIKLEWGQNAINEYERGDFSLDTLISDEAAEPLPSGVEVVNLLKRMPGFDINKLQDVTVGYKMSKDQVSKQEGVNSNSPDVISLEPKWYYRYNNEWKMFSQEDFFNE
ncbi:YycH family regulatory protein [Cytobacillus horneckiae]|uniref:Regulatory protein YycH domain-containing protein n=1 Tax=Cytobacillus horneckiae TaxID=549687 RepID=A0A2N0ZIW8_9BACI|nr:two-component system activity regulator YycH [Cytobacillus horneckiae]MEC1159022.1 two-component system activity regulator YycH [Cytobacillus horneckiae]MED2937976.1 two-component system activity regulator YycH [Cytobacillus horneckiae]PKG29457.1 hypothetical protein CWS20_08025 [Cytobacillus horneckiae]